MKLRKNTVFTAALVASLAGLSGFASAQITRFYSNAGSGSNAFAGAGASFGDLDSIGYDSSTFNDGNKTTFADGGTISTRPNSGPALPAYFQNYVAPLLPGSVSGQSLQSVELFIYAVGVNPDSQKVVS